MRTHWHPSKSLVDHVKAFLHLHLEIHDLSSQILVLLVQFNEDLGGFSSDVLLQRLDEADPLTVFLVSVFFVYREGEYLERLVKPEETAHLIDLFIQLSLVQVVVGLLLGDDLLITLRDDGDEEVEQDNQVNELVDEPDEPDGVDHHVLNGCFCFKFFAGLGSPCFVVWHVDIADGVPVTLNDVLD